MKLIFTLCISLMLLLSGCQSSFLSTTSQCQLVFSSPSDPSTFNYPLNNSAFNIFGYIYDGLILENGKTAELEPALAESWKISEDKKQIIFQLRQGLKWSDGQDLTAEDVVFSYNEIYFNPLIPSGLQDILRIGTTGQFPTVKALSDRVVQFTVPEPFAPFLRFTGGIPILPEHALKKAVRTKNKEGKLEFLSTWGTDTNPQNIITNGMYVIDKYLPSQRVVLKRNPYYWKKSQPYIEKIVIQTIESSDSQMSYFRSGDIDSIDVNPDQFRLLKVEEKKGKYTIYNGGASSDSRFLGFNLNKAKDKNGKPFVDPIKSAWFNQTKFRQAVAYAINREAIKNNIYRGLGVIQHSTISSTSPFYLSPEQGLKTYEYNPEKAKSLLLQAGFSYNSENKLIDSKGNPVRFTILVKTEEKQRVDSTLQIQQDLEAIGMKVDLQIISFNTVLQKLNNRDWEAYVGGFGGGGTEPHSGYNIWASQGASHQFNQGPRLGEDPIQGWVLSSWEKEIDRLFTEGVQELDETKRKQIYGKFQQIVAEEVPFFYLVNSLSLSAVRDRIENVKFTALGGAFWNLYELKLKGCH